MFECRSRSALFAPLAGAAVVAAAALAGLACDPAISAPASSSAAGSAPAVERYRVSLSGLPARGPAEAKVTLVEFMDYQCPFCRHAEETLAELRKAYPNDVRVQIVNNPLPMHENAPLAALAARAAGKQGKFWEMHERLLRSQGELDLAGLERQAAALGLDLGAFRAELESAEAKAELASHAELARKLGVRGTPSFFINGRRVVGAQPFAKLASVIDEELRAADALIARGVAPAQVSQALVAGGRETEAAALVHEEEPSCGGGGAHADCDCAKNGEAH